MRRRVYSQKGYFGIIKHFLKVVCDMESCIIRVRLLTEVMFFCLSISNVINCTAFSLCKSCDGASVWPSCVVTMLNIAPGALIGYKNNFASCSGGHVGLTRTLTNHQNVFACEFQTEMLSFFFFSFFFNCFLDKIIWVLIMHIYWMINLIYPVCSHAIQKMLMVWVGISGLMW